MANPNQTYLRSREEEQCVLFFREVKRELGLNSTVKAVGMVRKLIVSIVKSLNIQEAKALVSRMPSLLQMLFLNHWHERPKEFAPAFSHLDELVEYVYAEDQRSTDKLFHSEIEVLNVLLVTFTWLDKTVGLLEFPGFKHSFVQEIRKAPLVVA